MWPWIQEILHSLKERVSTSQTKCNYLNSTLPVRGSTDWILLPRLPRHSLLTANVVPTLVVEEVGLVDEDVLDDVDLPAAMTTTCPRDWQIFLTVQCSAISWATCAWAKIAVNISWTSITSNCCNFGMIPLTNPSLTSLLTGESILSIPYTPKR